MTRLNARASRHQTERHPAEFKQSPDTCKPLALAASQHLGDIGHPERQPAHDDRQAPLTKRKLALGSFSSGSPFLLVLTGIPMILPQCAASTSRFRALHLDLGQRQRHILADRLLPVRTGRRIGSQKSSLPAVWLNSMKAARQSRGCSCTP